MKTRRTIIALIVILSQLLSNVSTVHALPPLPSSFNGTVKVDGENVPDGTSVTAWMNGVQYASTLTVTFEGNSVYSLNVRGDDPGGNQGTTVVFHIDAQTADQTGTWDSGTSVTVNLTASLPDYSLSITSLHGTINKTPDQVSYHEGDSVSLAATPAPGYTFTGWTGDLVSSSNPASVTIHGNTSVTANYSLNQYTLSITKTGFGSGTVTSSPTGIDCGSACSYGYDYNTLVTLSADPTPGSNFSGWSDPGCPGLGTCDVTISAAKSVEAEFTLISEPTGLTCTNLVSKPGTATTGDKPQSKVWSYDGSWYAVFPTNASGASSAGTWLWKLVGTSWTEVIKLSDRTDTKADVKPAGNLVHILLYADSNTQYSTVAYVSGAYQLWATRPTLVNIPLPGSEIATIDIDSTGKLWLATRNNNNTGEIIVYHSDSPYSTWNGPIVLATGVIANDDIAVVTALPNGTVGVLWANENTKRFGFRIHVDGAAPATWGADELPAAGSANDSVGLGMSDDHLNVAVASDGTLYAAVKTSYDTAGYPKMALLIRRPTGVWDGLYAVDEAGTRPLVLLDEIHSMLTYIYTSSEGNNPIVYQQSSIGSIAFNGRTTLRSGSYNDASSMKDNITSDFVVIYGSGSEVAGQLCSQTISSGADLAITKTDGQSSVRPNDTLTYTITVTNSGPEAVTGATVSDGMPTGLVNVTWTCSAAGGGSCSASGSGSITDTVNLPVSATATYTVTAHVNSGAVGEIVNTATVTPPGGISDPQMNNNSASDTDTIRIIDIPCESDLTLVGCWQMEENGGSVLIDGSSYLNDASLSGAPTWITGKVGSYALDLNGTSQYGTVPDDSTLDLTNQLTLAVWINPEQYGTQSIINKATNGSVDGYELTLATTKTDDSSQRAFFRINQAANADTYRINALTMYPIDGSWMHVAATYDGTTMRLYINGVLESSMVVPGGIPAAVNTLPLTIGAQDGTAASRWFMGWLDDVRVYNRALTLAEIQALAGTPQANTIVGDGTTPANKFVNGSVTNKAVSAFTLATESAGTTDTVTGMTVTISGTGPGNVSTVKIYQDNGTTPNEWDAGDTVMGTASYVSPTATFSGLTMGVTSTATQYLITVDTITAPTEGQTLLAAVTSVTASNTVTNNDNTDATLTIDSIAPTISIGAPSATITAGGPVTYTVTYADTNFNESTLVVGNITLNKTGSANGTVGVTGSGLTRTVTISSITGNGTLGISIEAGTASDLAGNLAPATGPSTTFTVDNTYLLSVSKTGTGSGTVSSDPAGIDCGSTCSYSFDNNTAVTLTAMASPDSIFSGWSGEDCTGIGTCEVTMDAAKSITANFSPFVSTWYLAEGYTGAGFGTYILIQNPNATKAYVKVTYMLQSGGTLTRFVIVDENSRYTIVAQDDDQVGPGQAFSTKLEADQQIVVERAMYWPNGTGTTGGHVTTGIQAPATTWYLAEGFTGAGFGTYILIQNPNTEATDVDVTYMLDVGGVVTRTVSVPGNSRYTIVAQDSTQVNVDKAFSTKLVADLPIVVERAMYFNNEGHAAGGVTSPGKTWYLAEGYTGKGFGTYILIQNPNATEAKVDVTYMLQGGDPIIRSVTVPPNARYTIVAKEAGQVGPDKAFSTKLVSDQPIIVERAMYWPNGEGTIGGHDTTGVQQAENTWYLAEGYTGANFETFILLQNPNSDPTEVDVTYMIQEAGVENRTVTVPGNSRFTIRANDVDQLGTDKAFSTKLVSDLPIIVERAMYFPNGGHASAGVVLRE